MKTLIITEKPSVARDIANALGTFKRGEDFFENENYIISWSLGHIVELYEPEDYDKKYKFWTLQTLPIIPSEFKFKPIKKTEKRLKILKSLIDRKDVDIIVNACDAGREGELIFREILLLSKPKNKKIKRLWLSAMTKDEITREFKALRNASEFDKLGESAFSRTEGDWLVGINATRAFTRRWGTLLSIGRVQTPTLNIVCSREAEIRSFKPETYFELEGIFKKDDFTYKGTYISKDGNTRFKDADLIKQLQEKLKNKEGIVRNLQIKENRNLPPLLYDLTELQRDANKLFGYSAQHTLDIAQSLYETRKLITYPRTDSRFLPSSLKGAVKGIIEKLRETEYSSFSERILEKGIKFNSRIINDAGVTDHYAIIPTGVTKTLAFLKKDEANIFDLILKRFLSVFLEPAIILKINFDTEIKKEIFKTSLSQTKYSGWMEIYGEKSSGDFAYLKEKDSVKNISLDVLEKQTQPPQRFTEAALLLAMENAGKLIEDEELKEAMKEKGLGTPATRASIIERLIEVGYLERIKKALIPTEKGMRLIELASMMNVEEILSPALTGEWEKKLIDIERGLAKSNEFMNGIIDLTKSIVEKVKSYSGSFSVLKGSEEPLGKCPKCGGSVFEEARSFTCENVKDKRCDFVLWKKLKNRSIDRDTAVKLLNGEVVEIKKFLSSNKRYFNAKIKLEDGKITFVFNNTPDEKISDEPIGNCPYCGGKVYEGKETYFCEGGENCKFRMKKVMGNRLITRNELKELLDKKKTSLLAGFKSKSGKNFSAYLYIDEKGIVKFEFEKSKKEGSIARTRRGSKK